MCYRTPEMWPTNAPTAEEAKPETCDEQVEKERLKCDIELSELQAGGCPACRFVARTGRSCVSVSAPLAGLRQRRSSGGGRRCSCRKRFTMHPHYTCGRCVCRLHTHPHVYHMHAYSLLPTLACSLHAAGKGCTAGPDCTTKVQAKQVECARKVQEHTLKCSHRRDFIKVRTVLGNNGYIQRYT